MTYSSSSSNNKENNNNNNNNRQQNGHFRLTNDIDNDVSTLLDDDNMMNSNDNTDQLLLLNITTNSTTTGTTKNKKNNAGYILGLFFIFTVSIIWSASSVLVQYIYNSNDSSSDTKSSLTPFLVTYIGVSLFSILLIIDIVIQYIQYSISYCYKIICYCCCCLISNKRDNIMYEQISIEYNDDSSNNNSSNTINDQSENSCDSSFQNNDTISTTNNNNIIQESTTSKQYQQTSSQHQQQQQQIDNTTKKEWNTINYIKIALQIVPIWFIGNWSYNGSLLLTSITSSTVLASTSCVFTYLFALYYKDEVFTFYKLIGILLSVIGSIITTLNDNNDTNNSNANNTNSTIIQSVITNVTSTMVSNITSTTVSNNNNNYNDNHQYAVWGDILGILSAIGYAGYAIQTRVLCPRDDDDDDDDENKNNDNNIDNTINTNDTVVPPSTTTSAKRQQQSQSKKNSNKHKTKFHMHIMLGYVGLLSCILFSPIAIYQLLISGRSFISYKLFITLIVKGLMDNVLSDYLWLRAIILTNATIATVGLGLTIPLAFISDLLITSNNKNVLQLNSLIGALFVLLGFILVNIGNNDDNNTNTNTNAIENSTGSNTTTTTGTEEEEVDDRNFYNDDSNQIASCNLTNQRKHLVSMSITNNNNNEINDALYTIVQQQQHREHEQSFDPSGIYFVDDYSSSSSSIEANTTNK